MREMIKDWFKKNYYRRNQDLCDVSDYNPVYPLDYNFDGVTYSIRDGVKIITSNNTDQWRKKMMELCDEHGIEIIRK